MDSYAGCLRRYIRFVGRGIKAGTLAADSESGVKVSAYLNTLKEKAVSTQDVALNALKFFYEHALKQPFGKLPDFQRAKRSKRIRECLTREEAFALFATLPEGSVHRLILELMFGSGVRIKELLRLRIKDVDLGHRRILIRDGKGNKDRRVILAEDSVDKVRAQMDYAAGVHAADLREGVPAFPLPKGLERKFKNGWRQPGWFWLFPARGLTNPDRQLKKYAGFAGCRYHIHSSSLGKAIKTAARRAGIYKRVTAHSLRHSFATASMRQGVDILTLQREMGHEDIATTQDYLHCLPPDTEHRVSPFDVPPGKQVAFPVPLIQPAAPAAASAADNIHPISASA